MDKIENTPEQMNMQYSKNMRCNEIVDNYVQQNSDGGKKNINAQFCGEAREKTKC